MQIWSAVQDIIKEKVEASSKSSQVEELMTLHEKTKKPVTELESLSTIFLDYLNRRHSAQGNK